MKNTILSVSVLNDHVTWGKNIVILLLVFTMSAMSSVQAYKVYSSNLWGYIYYTWTILVWFSLNRCIQTFLFHFCFFKGNNSRFQWFSRFRTFPKVEIHVRRPFDRLHEMQERTPARCRNLIGWRLKGPKKPWWTTYRWWLEIRRSPVEVGGLSVYPITFIGVYTFQVVVWIFCHQRYKSGILRKIKVADLFPKNVFGNKQAPTDGTKLDLNIGF